MPLGFTEINVVDPDPYVFGPTGSGSAIICMDPDLDSDPSINKEKKEE
jgi:hypothetical protein